MNRCSAVYGSPARAWPAQTHRRFLKRVGQVAVMLVGTVRVLVDLRVSTADPSAIGRAQDEIDASALSRLEAMRALVARVRTDRIVPLDEGRTPRR